jgi:hypothetical protein
MNDSKNIKALVSARTFTQQNASSQNATVQNAVSFAGGTVQAITVLDAVASLTSPRNANAVGAVGEYVYISGTYKLVKITSAPANQNTYLVIGTNCVEVVGTFTIVTRSNNTASQTEIVVGNTYSIDGMVAPVILAGSITVTETRDNFAVTRTAVGAVGQYFYAAASVNKLVRITVAPADTAENLTIGTNCVEVTGLFTISAITNNNATNKDIIVTNTYLFNGTAAPVRQTECGSITVVETLDTIATDRTNGNSGAVGDYFYIAGTVRKLLRIVSAPANVDANLVVYPTTDYNCVEVTGVFEITTITSNSATLKDISAVGTYKFTPAYVPAPIAVATALSYPVVCGKFQAMSSGSIQLVNDYIICKTSAGQLSIIA